MDNFIEMVTNVGIIPLGIGVLMGALLMLIPDSAVEKFNFGTIKKIDLLEESQDNFQNLDKPT